VALDDDLERIAAAAARFAAEGESVAAVLTSEPSPGRRVYLCAFSPGGEERSWLALDDAGQPLRDRAGVREAVSITALCELAEEHAGGGDLQDLRAQLATLRLTEGPVGIELAEEAALDLERAVGSPPQVASPGRLDEIGAATRKLEHALGEDATSPFAEGMKLALGAVEALTAEVEAAYKVELGE
jgi:hypothetical protein